MFLRMLTRLGYFPPNITIPIPLEDKRRHIPNAAVCRQLKLEELST